jgi:hypothetical protein
VGSCLLVVALVTSLMLTARRVTIITIRTLE